MIFVFKVHCFYVPGIYQALVNIQRVWFGFYYVAQAGLKLSIDLTECWGSTHTAMPGFNFCIVPPCNVSLEITVLSFDSSISF